MKTKTTETPQTNLTEKRGAAPLKIKTNLKAGLWGQYDIATSVTGPSTPLRSPGTTSASR